MTVEKANCIPFERICVEVTSPWHLFDSSHHVGPLLRLFSGIHSKSLIPGVDCPEGAIFLNVSFFGETMVKATTLERAMCVFEQNTGVPLRRHLSYSVDEGAFYGGCQTRCSPSDPFSPSTTTTTSWTSSFTRSDSFKVYHVHKTVFVHKKHVPVAVHVTFR